MVKLMWEMLGQKGIFTIGLLRAFGLLMHSESL